MCGMAEAAGFADHGGDDTAAAEAAAALQFSSEEWMQWAAAVGGCNALLRGGDASAAQAWGLQADRRWHGASIGWGGEALCQATLATLPPAAMTDAAAAAAAWHTIAALAGLSGAGFCSSDATAMAAASMLAEAAAVSRADLAATAATAATLRPTASGALLATNGPEARGIVTKGPEAPRTSCAASSSSSNGLIGKKACTAVPAVVGQKVALDALFPNLDWSSLKEQWQDWPATGPPAPAAAAARAAAPCRACDVAPGSSQGLPPTGDYDEDVPGLGLDAGLAESVAAMALADLDFDLDFDAVADACAGGTASTSLYSVPGSPSGSPSCSASAAAEDSEVPSTQLTPELSPMAHGPLLEDLLWRQRSGPSGLEAQGRRSLDPVGTRPVVALGAARIPPPSHPPPPPPSGLMSWPSLGSGLRSS